MAPEQAQGQTHTIGPATDIYCLGALLYHLLTRQPPFQADTLTALLKRVIETDPLPPGQAVRQDPGHRKTPEGTTGP